MQTRPVGVNFLSSLLHPSRFSEYDEAINPLFVNNRRWVKRRLARDPEYFAKQEKGQSPSYLFIGCSDSRVPAQDILGLKAG